MIEEGTGVYSSGEGSERFRKDEFHTRYLAVVFVVNTF